MPRPSRPNAVAVTRIPITRVTMFMPIGPRRRAIGPDGTERDPHDQRRSPTQMPVMIARSPGLRNVVAWMTTVVIVPAPTVPGIAIGTTASAFQCSSGTSSADSCSAARELQLLDRHHADAVLQQNQAAGGLQHRHGDARGSAAGSGRPSAHQQDDQHGERALVGHAPLDLGGERSPTSTQTAPTS